MKKLPKNVKITELSPSTFSLEYQEFCWEPTIKKLQEVEKILVETAKNLEKLLKNFKLEKKHEFSVYVCEEDVCAGLTFSTKLSVEQMEKVLGVEICERN